ncbi:unnamed protein product [Alternaria alternata]
MSYGDDFAYANTFSEKGRSAPEITLADKHSRTVKFSDGGDSNAETSSDKGNSATGTSSDRHDSNTKASLHEDCDTSTESDSDEDYDSDYPPPAEEDAKVSSRSLSELLSVARKIYPERHEKYIAKRAREFASLSDIRYAFVKICCKSCYVKRPHHPIGHAVSMEDLSEDCDFCCILRTCQQHFANDGKYMMFRFSESINNLQICFRDDALRHRCRSNHVQLYSKESRTLQTPFRYAEDVHRSVESEASISVMKRWISDCSTFHQHVSPIRSLNPTRLIRLGSSEDDGARLYSPKHTVVYAALSYRWGSGKQSKTTKDNVTERYQELKTSDFPKTLRDAIHITRRLGLEYIWIDRICIIQDDKEDWANEASVMADIYASAYVVLSATATENCRDGFLQKRPKPLPIQYPQHGQKSQEVYARQIETHNCRRPTPKTDYELYKRGWCMQERFLACRIIHFLPDEILFECQAGRRCECGGAANESEKTYDQPGGYNNFGKLQAAKSMEEQEFTFNWTRVVQRYSQTKLTYGKDSLSALSGIAACVQHLNPGKYIAGLWEKDIGIQLAWFIDPSRDLTRRWEDPKNINILGPTFSWSSHVMGSVQFPCDGDLRSLCNLESSNIDLATSNLYGQIRDATICLSGRLVSGYDMIAWLKTHTTVDYYNVFVYFDSGPDFMFVYKSKLSRDYAEIEKLENTISWETVMCFGLYEKSYIRDVPYIDTLLVQPSKTEAGQYVRIGLIQHLDKSWFDNTAVASTITLA